VMIEMILNMFRSDTGSNIVPTLNEMKNIKHAL